MPSSSIEQRAMLLADARRFDLEHGDAVAAAARATRATDQTLRIRVRDAGGELVHRGVKALHPRKGVVHDAPLPRPSESVERGRVKLGACARAA
jgi:hypothetical protein